MRQHVVPSRTDSLRVFVPRTAAKELGLQQAIEVAYFPTTARFAPVDDRRIDLKEHPEVRGEGGG